MNVRWLFVAAYTSSGLAGLIYEVSWTRLLTLYMGHTTAAASTVVAAFMGGLAGGALLGGRVAPRLTSRQALYAYVILESLVGFIALVLPAELAALTPLLSWAYRNGAPGLLFPAIRLLACLAIMLVPATALGATFPLAVRWFVTDPAQLGRAGGGLYAANSTGAAIGALAAGFALIPAIGISGTTLVGVAASGLAVAGVLAVAYTSRGDAHAQTTARTAGATSREKLAEVRRPRASRFRCESSPSAERWWLAGLVLGLSGFATLMYEIAWMRVFALIIGPTTYAFAATLAALITGVAGGSAIGSWIAGRTVRPALWLALALAGTAIAAAWTSSLAGGDVPRLVAQQFATSPQASDQLLIRHVLLVAGLILPTALGLGAAFPLALGMAGGHEQPVARHVGIVYAINTLAAASGALAVGFVAIPHLGLQSTLRVVSVLLVVDAFTVVVWGRLSMKARVVGLCPALVALAMVMVSPRWDRELLASGLYKYASFVPKELELEPALTAGTLLYYHEGAASTVSVKRLTGTISLAIDGKVDASSTGDMLTQKTLAHLPLLLHPHPQDVVIIGLGSGVTLASALVHPVASVDVVEISPDVVEASRYFAAQNRNALDDPRTHLIPGDGRSHLLLSTRQYDVIISEPSNPWMAGVAALFTREFFTAARNRLAPGGIICQWAHTYEISDSDLRSIVATFASVFPDGTMWLIGESDVLLVASTGALDSRLADLEQAWQRPGVAADLRDVSALEPFALWSLFVGGPQELRRYAAGAALQTDDRMALEFSGPRALYDRAANENASKLRELLDPQQGPPIIRRALTIAGAPQWRNRGAMMLRVEAYATAYQDYVKALTLDPSDAAALDGLVRTAVVTHREAEALGRLRSLMATHPQTPAIWIATSKLLAATGSADEAIAAARAGSTFTPSDAAALEQLASVFADLGDASQLDPIVARLQRLQPRPVGALYYAAASKFLHGQLVEALRLAQQTIALDTQDAAAYNLLGAIHASLDERLAAREAFQAALRLNPRDSATYTNLGLLELASANWSSAAGYFAEALSLDPGSTAARQGLAQARQGIPE